MSNNTLVFIIFVALMCCALASLIYFCAAEVVFRCQPSRMRPSGSPGLDDHFADVQRIVSRQSPASSTPTPPTGSPGLDEHVADERRGRSGETPSLYASPTSPTSSAGVEDLRTLGATVFRAQIAGDTGTLRALSATTDRVDLLNGMILAGEFVVVELAKARGQTPDEVATALHHEAIDRRLNQTVGGDGDSQ